MPAAPLRLVALNRAFKLGLDRVLHADVERQAHGRPLGERRTLHRLDADHLVDIALDAGDALVVDVDVAENVPGERASGIGAAQLAAEVEARQAEVMHGLRRLGREPAPDPDEAAGAVGKILSQRVPVESVNTVRSFSTTSSRSSTCAGSANSEYASTSVARRRPLRSTMSGRAKL